MRIILLGPPGAGKGTQAQWVARHWRIPTISTGDMLRSAIQSDNDLGRDVAQNVKQGKLVPGPLMIRLVKERLKEPDCKKGFLLDGFPRNSAQAKALDEADIFMDYVIHLDVSDEEVIRRLSGRRFHPASGRTYHVEYNPPLHPDKDDITGEPLVQREDDKPLTIKKRLAIYHQQTQPLIAYYLNNHPSVKNKVLFKTLPGVGKTEEVFKSILAIVSR